MTVERTIQQERLASIVNRFSERRIVVIGDVIADRFLHGTISRVSREAPVFILRHDHTETLAGGAANCAMNLASLGAEVSLVGVVGKDEAAGALRDNLMAAGVKTDSLVQSAAVNTTTKVRILAGQLHSSKQQVIRIDYEDNTALDKQTQSLILEQLRNTLLEAEAIIISDYNYGVVDDEAANILREIADKKFTPIFVDSRFKLSNFKGFTSGTPNEDEVEQLIGEPITCDAQLEVAATKLREQLGYRALLVTRGSKGMMLVEEHISPLHLKAVGALEPVDVTGAGDTVIATFALALASDASFSDAARLANYAGGAVVMKRGTASVTPQELEQSIRNSLTA
ncbi:MAG: bifunctional heptose 7-phosphate kinase/heptose 1-phosphate adenyltransferase [Pyrinomonadaceae bacterium]